MSTRTTRKPSSAWSSDELDRIVRADDLKIAPLRDDGLTTGTPTWIWCVAVDGALYVRAYYGAASSWYQAAQRQKAGRIVAAGAMRDVAFEQVADGLQTRIDAAYQAKYAGSHYLTHMVSGSARQASVRIVPR